MIKEIVNAVTIPVMAKVRIGHFVEAQVRHHPRRVLSFLKKPRFQDSASYRYRLYR